MTTRRDFLQTTAAAGVTMALPMGAQAQSGEGIRLGLLTVKTGPLASGGIDMERALVMYLAERNNMMAGQKVQLIVADTGGVPANAKSKVQELVELNKVHVLMGPLAAFEALAIDAGGEPVQTLNLGSQAAGVLPINWNGMSFTGNKVADGNYSIQINATTAGKPVSATGLQFGTVSSVSSGANGMVLNLDNKQSVSGSSIKQIL